MCFLQTLKELESAIFTSVIWFACPRKSIEIGEFGANVQGIEINYTDSNWILYNGVPPLVIM